ncbi:MAG TPA: hypothetical protein VFD58_37335 [Blastocatellia bacterium]|nr:hypothetical protein [Blastocatellia bacterium]
MTGQTNIDEIKAALRDGWFRDYEPGAKAGRYVGQFSDRQLTGRKITARVVGNHGVYTVSLEVSDKGVKSACSCYIGGGCHHCDALAQTFLGDAESFRVMARRTRTGVRTLDDLKSWLKGVTLDDLTQQLKGRGITQSDLAGSIGMSPRHLTAIKSSEARNRYFHELGAVKLACLWVIENIQPAEPKAAGKKKKR